MKVLIVNITKPDIDTRSIKLKRALEKQGHDVDFYWALNAPKVKIMGKEISVIGYGINLIKNLIVTLRGNFDVVHLIDGWDIALLPFLFTRKAKVFDIRSHWSYMLSRVRTDTKSKFQCFLKDLVTQILISRSNGIVTVDPRLAQRIKRLGAKDITYLRNLPEKDMFDRVGFERNFRYLDFAYVGTFATARRTQELLVAWHRFVRHKPIPCRLFLIGWDCSGDNYFENNMEPYIDNESVFYLGRAPFDEIAKVYRKMDFIVIPNMGDHWQLKVGESLAAGVPVILRDGPLHRMMVKSIGAVYFESSRREDDAEAIEVALETAFDNRNKLTSEARSREPPYWGQDVERVVKMYQTIRGVKSC